MLLCATRDQGARGVSQFSASSHVEPDLFGLAVPVHVARVIFMKMTATSQRNAVSEGAALGFVALGYDRINFEKVRVDLAFEATWRNWPYSSRFSQVGTDVRQGLDGVNVMTHASEKKHTACFYWERGNELTIFWRQHDFNPTSDDDLMWAAGMVDGDVPLEGWKTLAQGFLDVYLDR